MFRLIDSGGGHILPHLYGSSAFIVGAGPSLRNLTIPERQAIHDAPAIRFALNHGGRGQDGEPWRVRPTHWTAYDPTAQFSRSLFLDPTITKFVKASRSADLIPGPGYLKIGDAPGVVLYSCRDKISHSEKFNPFGDWILDIRDSLVLTMSLAVHLGCRKLYLLGTDMKITPSQAQLDYALEAGVKYPVRGEVKGNVFRPDPSGERWSDRLSDFVYAISVQTAKPKLKIKEELSALEQNPTYAISEQKSFFNAINTDGHYSWITEHLRQSRLSLQKYGIEVISCTPDSRLNQFFEYQDVSTVCESLKAVSDVSKETTKGAYTGSGRVYDAPFMQDQPVYGHPPSKDAQKNVAKPAVNSIKAVRKDPKDVTDQPVEMGIPVAEDDLNMAFRKRLEAI